MAVIIGNLVNRFNVDDSTNALFQLDGARDVATLELGGKTFVYATGREDHGVTVFELGANGTLSFVQSISDTAALALFSATGIAFVTIGGASFAFVAGANDDGVSVFSINPATGALTHVQTTFDSGALELDGVSYPSTVSIGGTPFLIAPGSSDSGLSVFQVNADGTLTNTSNVDGQTVIGVTGLAAVNGIATAVIGAKTFVFASSSFAGSVDVFELSAGGVLSHIGTTSDNATLNLGGAIDVATATIGATTYLFVSGGLDSGISVFSVDGNGALTNVFNLSDTGALGLAGARDVDIFELGGETFLSVSSPSDDALSYFVVNADGSLTVVETVRDAGAFELDRPIDHSFTLADGKPYLLSTGFNDDGLSVFEIGGGNDTLTGTAGADTILGLAGTDFLIGGEGDDRLYGGADADVLFHGGGGDLFDGGAGIDYVTYASGTAGAGENMRIDLLNPDANSGLAAGDTFVDVEAFFLSQGNDLFSGDTGDNFVFGQDGADFLAGAGGRDIIYGEGGNDFINSGVLGDILSGGSGADTFYYGLNQIEQDQILDFTAGEDKLAFEDTGFNLVFQQPFAGINFISTTAAAGASYGAGQSVFIYYSDLGLLYADTDGGGGSDANLIAALSGTPNLSASDFIFI